MINIACRNVNDGLAYTLIALEKIGVNRGSRNGDVKYFPVPVSVMYHEPRERVLWNAKRDANPFFHFFESLWMLAGRNDVAFPAQFAKKIKDYSDDTRSLNGAYGHRWKTHFGKDQIKIIVDRLTKNPDDRRCVLQMWDATKDLGSDSKDVPCNTNIFFSVAPDGKLDMTVLNRSNDIVWGCFGANAVHFSFLQEYIACCLVREVGRYWQFANNLHLYDFNKSQVETVVSLYKMFPEASDLYSGGSVAPYPLHVADGQGGMKTWDEDLLMFMDHPLSVGFRDPFFRRVAVPMMVAWKAYSSKGDPDRYRLANDAISQCHAKDWSRAVAGWLNRREFASKEKSST